jgi:hypothetical protein
MYQGKSFSKVSMAAVLSAMLALDVSAGLAQTKPATVPDAQIEASVLKTLAGAPELADQAITSTTVYGVVTLNGTVRDEPSRDLAEHLVSTTAGVQKVVDQLVIGAVPAASNDSADGGTNPNLQSDGSIVSILLLMGASSSQADSIRLRMVRLRRVVSIRRHRLDSIRRLMARLSSLIRRNMVSRSGLMLLRRAGML